MQKRKRRVYVAGAYSAGDVLSVFRNMRRGMRLATMVFQAGALPFAPWFDYHFLLQEREEERRLEIEDLYQYSLSFLENWAEAVLVVQENWVTSKGTVNEINRAEAQGLPVFFSLEGLVNWIRETDIREELDDADKDNKGGERGDQPGD